MNFTPDPFKHAWNVLSAVKSAVVGSCFANGMVSSVDPPDPPDALVEPEALALSEAGWIAPFPFFVTVQPGGSWRSTCPAEITLSADCFELDPQPAATTENASTAASASEVAVFEPL